MRIMAIGAHPDDIEMYCSGTLCAYRARGDEVVMACVTNGDKGAVNMTTEELARIRERETSASAEILGAELMFLGLPDGELFVCPEHRAVLIDAIRQARPDVIITHNPDDYLSDHRTTSELVFSAGFFASTPNVRGLRDDLPAYPAVPPVYYMDTPMGVGFSPTDYVDITPHMEAKRRIIECHESQVQWLREHDNCDMPHIADIMAQFRGMQCGVQYAEGFRKLDQWPRIRAQRLLP